jgi:hypothetical protein
MEQLTPGTSWQIDGDGSLVGYDDPFKNVSQDDAELAAQAEQQIIDTKSSIEVEFLRLAYLMDEFESRHLYLARGYETMRAWAESPEIEFSWRVAQDLIRIRREVIPLLQQRYGGSDNAHQAVVDAGISKVRAVLPLLRDKDKVEDFMELIEAAPSMPWNDVRNEVKERRGMARPLDESFPVLFRGEIKLYDEHANIRIFAIDGTTTDQLGTLRIRREWLPRFEERFGSLIGFDGT